MPPQWLMPIARYSRHLPQKFKPHSRLVVHRCFHIDLSHRADVTPLRKEIKDANKRLRTRSSPGLSRLLEDHDKHHGWELTVGIEVHAQLNTTRKLFSRSRPNLDSSPNSNLAPFDVALPGSQPLLELSALVPALRAAIALNCNIESVSRFDRKHYFYHDQPSGYQITQYYQPFARNGSITLRAGDGLSPHDGKELFVGIKQIQMEQDTAKTQESEDGTSSIDFTRSGQPLIEIISLPHLHSPEAAAAYLRKVQAILFSVDAVTTGMELGGLRADVNVSVRRRDGPQGIHNYSGVTGLGQRTEIKNLSSFRAVEDAVKAERDRQIAILEAGGQVKGETRGWSLTHPNETRRLRGKEGEVDYRYMPDPDVPPLHIGRDLVDYLKTNLPPTPQRLIAMLVDLYGLSTIDAGALLALEDGQRLIYFQEVVEQIPLGSKDDRISNGKVAGNWVLHELGALLSISEKAWTPEIVPAKSLARIVELLHQVRITGKAAKTLLRTVFEGDRMAVDDIATRDNLWFSPLSDDELDTLASELIKTNPDVATSIRKGNHRQLGFFVGLMIKTAGQNRVDAKKAETHLRRILLR